MMSNMNPTGVTVRRTCSPPESSSSGGQRTRAAGGGEQRWRSQRTEDTSLSTVGDVRGRMGSRGLWFPLWEMWLRTWVGLFGRTGPGTEAVSTWARDVESDTLRPGAVASQRGGPHSGRVVSRGQQGQVDTPKLGISKAGHTQHCGLLRATQNSWLGRGQGHRLGLGQGASGVPTSPRRRYLISYLRISPLGSDGSSQRRRTLLLLAASQATFPGIPSASPVGESIRQPPQVQSCATRGVSVNNGLHV